MIGRRAYDELVYGGHLLALGTSSIACCVAIISGLAPTLSLALMAYLFTYGAYSMNRASEPNQDSVSHPERTAYLERRKRYIPMISLGCFALGYILAYLDNLTFFLALLAPLALSVAYSLGSRSMKKAIGVSRLKEGLLVKNLVVALGWSLIPILVGLYYEQITSVLLLTGPFIFLRLLENTIFFDIRDVRADEKYGTRTIPSVFGLGMTERILDAVDTASLLYLIVCVLLNLLPYVSMLLALFPLYSFAYRKASDQSNLNVIRDLVADGEYVLWLPVILLGKV